MGKIREHRDRCSKSWKRWKRKEIEEVGQFDIHLDGWGEHEVG